jgi:hypothetical protein
MEVVRLVWTVEPRLQKARPAGALRKRSLPREETKEHKRVKGIEPSCVAWEATVLPLNYTRIDQLVRM